MKRLLSIDCWIGVLCASALGGIICLICGMLMGNDQLAIVGKCLIAPILVFGVLMPLILIPVFMKANRKHLK